MFEESQPGHIDHIKQINAGVVYRLIDQHGPVSRIELSKLAQLAPASITKIVREMMEAHLVRECEIAEPGNRGRPATGLELDCEGWHFLAIRLHNRSLLMTLRDLSGKTVTGGVVDFPTDPLMPLADFIIGAVEQFFSRHQSVLERLTAITITLPGLINARSGVVHRLPEHQEKDIPLARSLNRQTGLSVYIQHDISARMLAEHYFGAARGVRDAILLVMDKQVGAAVITAGQLLHKNSSALVEIGHTRVDASGEACYCGNRGCLETVVGTESLLKQAHERMLTTPDSLLHKHDEERDTRWLCRAAMDGDPLACEIITTAGELVGRSLAMMVNIFNPQYILIGSPLNSAAEILFPAITAAICREALPAYSEQVSLRPAEFNQPGTLPGTALVKDALYSGELLVRLLQG
ncbi:sugar metabolism global transcriptional regulator Mlc [Tatumella citrea]|uniref:Transcriptional regulator n=1 Tax=Tatumella citrea TaxID=53336 RepID=A0A1Y0LJ36_TATCI|nr:ROK family transcriptional regulator [Tatumella citrea]ARU94064.1 transcriptional regulator [Tatumella citrea]ARU98102.1 transcriptional regulator [Tatumella citrea]